MIGGDSDLVLEGLTLRPEVTHNVFVVLPDKKKKSYVVSIWEATRSITKVFPELEDQRDVLNIRTDLVLLFILNGNDYFPKMRGGNFERFFDAYKKTLRRNLEKRAQNEDASGLPVFLIDPVTLEFNVDFAVDFFEELAGVVTYFDCSWRRDYTSKEDEDEEDEDGDTMIEAQEEVGNDKDGNGVGEDDLDSNLDTDQEWDPRVNAKHLFYKDIFASPLNALNMLIAQNILPRPYPPKMTFQKIKSSGHNMRASLTVGGDARTRPVTFEINYSENAPGYSSKKRIKQLLAGIALDELLPGWERFYDDLNPPCDVKSAVHDNEEYVKGLIWNLNSYKKGVCVDYSYNYGRRRSPSVLDMAKYFKAAQEKVR